MERYLHAQCTMLGVIVLDPGHGGAQDLLGSSANRAVGPQGTLEKTKTLEIALATAQRLRAASHEVLLTRNQDVNVGAAGRAAVARDANAAAFVSIHLNAYNDPTVQGTETLVRPPAGSTLAELDPASTALADAIQSAMSQATGHANLGLKPGPWAVLAPRLHHAGTARCLVEISFLTDPAEEQRLGDPAYIAQVADALAQGIAHGLERTVAPVSEQAAYRRAVGGVRTTGWSPRRARRDPDGYGGYGGEAAVDIDDEGEGNENDVGEPIAIVQGGPAHNDSHCPENHASTASTAHFSLSEFRCRDGTDCPERFRGHLQLLMENLEVLRTELGETPININSGYRTPSYNQRIDGAPQSKHMCGMAADFRADGYTPQEVYAVVERLQNAGRMRAGGLHAYNSFVHYDVRGRNARW